MRHIRIISLFAVLCLLLTGCFQTGIFSDIMNGEYILRGDTSFQNMTYTRPDMDAFTAALDTFCQEAEQASSFEGLVAELEKFDQVYSDFLTNYHLSNIHYSADLTDTHWEEEYNFCMDHMASVEQGMERLYRTLARSQFREELESEDLFGPDFFDDYDGDQLYDDYFVSLKQQEADLETQYYDLCDQASDMDPGTDAYYDTYGVKMLELYVQLVALRQEIARYAGYDGFAHYTYDQYYGRDFTPEQAEVYLEDLGKALKSVGYSLLMSDDWGYISQRCTESRTFAYVEKAAKAMGGTITEAFESLKRYKLYDITYSDNKFNSSFEVFLPSYSQPFIFMNPSGYDGDKLTFAHEFGHFANDYVCGGSYCGIDVAEVHSQSFEYLSLCYGGADTSLTRYKMVDSLLAFLQCAAHGLFELRVYQLTDSELTVENILDLYDTVVAQFGLDDWGLSGSDVAQIPHFYTNPMYMVSYVVSNDLAMQIYQKELEKSGDGLQLYKQALESGESGIVAFAGAYGLDSPFQSDRPQELARFFREAFGQDGGTVIKGGAIGLSVPRIAEK